MEYQIQSEPSSISPVAARLINDPGALGGLELAERLDPHNCRLPAIYPLVLESPNPDLLAKLYQADAHYVSIALYNLTKQLRSFNIVSGFYFSTSGSIMFNVGRIAEFCALFQGFVSTGEVECQDTGIPILDIEVPKERWVFEVSSDTTLEKIASFAITVMGLSAGHGAKEVLQDVLAVPGNKESCQAQVRAYIQWKRYLRHSSQEELYVGNITKIIGGMSLRPRSDKEYKKIYADRYTNHVKQIGATTAIKKKVKYTYVVENEASSAYAFDIPFSFHGRSLGNIKVPMSSTCKSKIAFNAEFPRGIYDIKGPSDNPVILSVMENIRGGSLTG